MTGSLAALVVLILTQAGCSPQRDPDSLFAADAVGTLVVRGVLIVDQPLPAIRLTRTQAPDAPYVPRDAAVSGATVTVRSGAAVFDYVAQLNAWSGLIYVPLAGSPPPVLPETRYDLEIVTADGETLTATTTTPRRFAIDSWTLLAGDGQTKLRDLQTFASEGSGVYFHPDNRLVYPEGVLDARFTGSDASYYAAAGFQVALFSLDPEADFVIDPPFLEDEDLEDLPRLGSSPALDGEDGYVRLPWFTIFYQGRYLYKAFAVDRNWFDLVRTQPQGGGAFAPGGNLGDGTDPPLFRVNGGIGLFASAAVDSVGFLILPPQ